MYLYAPPTGGGLGPETMAAPTLAELDAVTTGHRSYTTHREITAPSPAGAHARRAGERRAARLRDEDKPVPGDAHPHATFALAPFAVGESLSLSHHRSVSAAEPSWQQHPALRPAQSAGDSRSGHPGAACKGPPRMERPRPSTTLDLTITGTAAGARNPGPREQEGEASADHQGPNAGFVRDVRRGR